MLALEIFGAASVVITIFSAGIAVGKYISNRKKTANSLQTIAIFFYSYLFVANHLSVVPLFMLL